MKKINNKLLYKILFFIGLCPFLAPFIYYFILIFAHNEHWNLLDLWILWSFVYWPTYIAGVITIAFSVYKLKNK